MADISSMTPRRRREQAKFTSLLRELNPSQMEVVLVVMRAYQSDAEIHDGPDGELIWLCNRLAAVNAGIAAVHEALPNDNADRRFVLATLDSKWREIEPKFRKVAAPNTPEGARALGKAALSQCPRDHDGAVMGDLASRLTAACASYLAGEVLH